MAGSPSVLASIRTALLALVLLWRCGDAAAMQKRAEPWMGPLAPETPEVMAVTHKANSKMGLDMEPDAAMRQIYDTYLQNVQQDMAPGCTKDNIAVRKEWSDLSPRMRRSFIDACHCMANLPAKTNRSWAPGVRTRWDDWVAPHIRNWHDIHFSVWNTIWHRKFVWNMEQAMRHECGYTGWMPFFDWSRYLDSPDNYPLFDNSNTSISGDGDHRSETCSFVTEGPFKNWQVNLGPVKGTNVCVENPRDDGLGYNPRPLERSFNIDKLQNLTYEKVAATILNVENMNEWVLRIDARGLGLHSMAHVFMGGLQANIPASAGDCWFFLHHCMVDRLWSFWQMQDPANRLYQIATNQHEFDPFRTGWPPAPPISLDAKIHISDVFRDVTVRDVMSTTQGQFCYMYE